MPSPLPASRTADISPDQRYRYTLTHTWDSELPALGWIMLNPSTADHQRDDPTIRRVVGFSRAWGWGGVIVRNLYAYRATRPGDLMLTEDPIGPDNDAALGSYPPGSVIVCAWGANIMATANARSAKVVATLTLLGANLRCLGTTSDGSPRHPLYVPNGTPAQPWHPHLQCPTS